MSYHVIEAACFHPQPCCQGFFRPLIALLCPPAALASLQANVAADFRGTGILALKGMAFFCQNYDRKVEKGGGIISSLRVVAAFNTRLV